MLILLMDVYSYIFVIKCHLCISEKLCFYTVYIAVILLLLIHAWRLLSAAKRTAHANLVPRVFLVVARELRKTLVKYDEISKILGDLSHAQ
jgi:hypothetical protein